MDPALPGLSSHGRHEHGRTGARGSRARLRLWAAALAATLCGCRSSPPGQAVASLRIVGNDAVSESYIRERIATAKAPKFLGLFHVPWLGYEPFEPGVLDRDLDRIERIYQRLGYYEARARVARVEDHGRFVDITIVVTEGRPIVVRRIDVTGLSGLPADEARDVATAVTLSKDDRFDEQKFEESAAAMAKVLHDTGYPYATVEPHAALDLGPRAADVSYAVVPGVRATIGSLRFEGLGGLPESPIRRAFDVDVGSRYSADALEDGRLAILKLGVLSSALVEPDLSDPQRTEVPVLVRVVPAKLNGVRAGGGVQVDASRAEVHALVGWESRNMLGGLRGLTLEERPSVVFFPTAIPGLLPPTHLLWGNRITAQLRQPSFLEARTNATLHVAYSIYPVLLAPINPDAQVILGYQEVSGTLGLQRAWQVAHFIGEVDYNLQANFPFTYFGNLNPDLTRVYISYLDLGAQLDLRDDPVTPHRGFTVANSLQFAGGPLGGSADDVRERPSFSMYVPLGDGVTLASRVLFGFLFPRSYAQDDVLLRTFPEFPPVRDLQIMFFRGFFSGGPDSNRGYGFREIGPHGLAIYNIADPAEAVVLCNPASPDYDVRLCSTATGGLTLWEASIEGRYHLTGPLGAVTFVDASDVSPRPLDVRLTAPHLSVGFGIRYGTPVGPVRVDLGFRIPGAQFFGAPPEGEGPTPKPLVGNIPAALWFGIGEAY